MNFDILNKFNIDIIQQPNSFLKIRVDASKLCEFLHFLQNNAEFNFDRLNTIIAVDLGVEIGKFELIYDLHSTETSQMLQVSVILDRSALKAPSVVEIFKSAYFDECEIYDMFGITFDKNPDLKRLLMPKGWIGFPLRKDYKLEDDRLSWNEVESA